MANAIVRYPARGQAPEIYATRLNSQPAEIYHCTTRYVFDIGGDTIKITAIFVVDETTNFEKLHSKGLVT